MNESEIAKTTRTIASGDTEALARFYSQWFDPMYAMARRSTGRDESFCLDVVQECMMRVIRSIKPMATESELRRWLHVVVRSCALDALRRELPGDGLGEAPDAGSESVRQDQVGNRLLDG